jgi:hypothetical protein
LKSNKIVFVNIQAFVFVFKFPKINFNHFQIINTK